MHKKAGLDLLSKRREDHLLSLMYTRTKKENYVDNTARVTRQAGAPLLKLPRPLTSRLTRAPIYRGGKLWNELSVTVRQALSKADLKNRRRLEAKEKA